MSHYQYKISNGRYSAVDAPFPTIVLDSAQFAPELISRYRALLAHKRDLDYAMAYLDQMFFQTDTSLIDGALINSAIQLLAKCFASPSQTGRKPLNATKVFQGFAKKTGHEVLLHQFEQFQKARNTVLSHDEVNHAENIVGITVDLASGVAVDVTGITIRTTYLYKQNQQLLKRMISLASAFVDDQTDKVAQKIIAQYNATVPQPNLQEVNCEGMTPATAW